LDRAGRQGGVTGGDIATFGGDIVTFVVRQPEGVMGSSYGFMLVGYRILVLCGVGVGISPGVSNGPP
jgi:hypothetical protein